MSSPTPYQIELQNTVVKMSDAYMDLRNQYIRTDPTDPGFPDLEKRLNEASQRYNIAEEMYLTAVMNST